MPPSLSALESARTRLFEQFLTLGDFRPGTFSAAARRCGKSSCHCADPASPGHPQFRLLRKVKGKSVAESFPTLAAFRQAATQVSEFHRFQALSAELTALNEQICRLRPVESEPGHWTEQGKKRLLRFIEKSRAKASSSLCLPKASSALKTLRLSRQGDSLEAPCRSS